MTVCDGRLCITGDTWFGDAALANKEALVKETAAPFSEGGSEGSDGVSNAPQEAGELPHKDGDRHGQET